MSIHLIFADAHAHPQHNNTRADYLGQLIKDVQPDVVIDGGDTGDFASLASYDKGKRSFVGRSFAADVESHNEFQDRVWFPSKRAKKKLPRRIRLIGNHEQRIDRVLDLHPELTGTVDYKQLELERYYDTVVPYNGGTPGSIQVDGISYAHYFVSGVMGRPISGEHQAYTLLAKKHCSCTQGHTHVFDFKVRSKETGGRIQGLVTPCFMDYKADWAGEINKLWDQGVIIKRNVEDGRYDVEYISMSTLKKLYG